MLTDHGLAAALEDLTADAALPVRLELEDGRFGADVEAAAYFLVAEGAGQRGQARGRAGGDGRAAGATTARLVIAVSDDGRGGADPLRGSGLHGLADRVAALGGTLDRRQPCLVRARRCAPNRPL